MTVVSNSADKPKREGPRSDPGGMWKLSMTLTKTSGVTDHKTQNFDTIKVKVIIPSLWFSELGPRTSLIPSPRGVVLELDSPSELSPGLLLTQCWTLLKCLIP